MTEFDCEFHADHVDPTVFRAAGSIVLGRVAIGSQSSVWFNAVIRGDTESITIGCQTNIQDGSVLHADHGVPCRLGDRVTVGHGAIVHGAFVDDDTLIGMRAVVMNRAQIARGSIVGSGAVVTEGTQVPENSLVLGMPGRVVRQTTPEERANCRRAADHYVAAAAAFAATQPPREPGGEST